MIRIYQVNLKYLLLDNLKYHKLGIDLGDHVFNLSQNDILEVNGNGGIKIIIPKIGPEIIVNKTKYNLVLDNQWISLGSLISNCNVLENVTEQIKRDRILNKILE